MVAVETADERDVCQFFFSLLQQLFGIDETEGIHIFVERDMFDTVEIV